MQHFSPQSPNSILMQMHRSSRSWHAFTEPVAILTAHSPAEVAPVLAQVAAATEHDGLWAVGLLCYEAAPGFDPALATRPHASATAPLPQLWFGLYRHASPAAPPPQPMPATCASPLNWTPDITGDDYRREFDRIQAWIAAGDCYQVNFTHRLTASAAGTTPWELFQRMHQAQAGGFSAFLNLGDHVIASASPELFFELNHGHLRCAPMKGTARRGITWAADRDQARLLHRSEKERAENLMIVDMVRNDLGRIAIPGTVHVPHLFRCERYPTLWQMTSTISADTRASLPQIMQALFPCASITGAPKVRAMQIITETETSPRGLYTGALGWIAPGGRHARFSVAIRTAVCHPSSNIITYGVGGGIVADSQVEREAAECRTKARIVTRARPPFNLLETMRWSPARGIWLRAAHLQRLRQSARYFRYPFNSASIERALDAAVAAAPAPQGGALRVRLQLTDQGETKVEAIPFTRPRPRPVWTLALADSPIDSQDTFLQHKTTRREVYDAARQSRPEVDDVVLWNERGELTETTLANLALQLDDHWLTPPQSAGLLPGTQRQRLLKRGLLREQLLTRADLRRATGILLFNSVRGLIRSRMPRLPEAEAEA